MLGPPQSEIGHNREKRKKKFAPILWVLLPVRLTLCDFEAPGGGALVSAQCCAVFFWQTEYVCGGFCDCCLFCCVWFDAIPIPDDTKDDTMLSPFFKLPTLRTDQLITLPFLFCCVCLFVCLFCFCFCFWLFFCFLASAPSEVAHCDFEVGCFGWFLWACVNMAHKLSFACAEMIPSYHLLPQ